jgi:hypothetical protein
LRDLKRGLDARLMTLSDQDIVSITHSESGQNFFWTRPYFTVLVVYIDRGE